MANSQKLSELTQVRSPEAKDLFLLSRDPAGYTSHAIKYEDISANLYDSIYIPLNAKIDALSAWVLGMLSGEPSLTAISSNAGNMVTNTPTKMVGIKAIYDLAHIINEWKPKWQ